jgi:RimJ/RimL family protein N-acetyltransferase
MLKHDDVVLRAFEATDCDLLFAMANDMPLIEMAAREPPRPQPRQVFEERISRAFNAPFTGANWALEFLIERNGAGIGIAGLYEMDRVNSVVEIGIAIGMAAERRKGAATSATLLLVRYAFDTLNFRRIVANVKASNAPAVLLAEKLGLAREGCLRQHRWRDGHFEDLLVFGLLRDDWEGYGEPRTLP